MIHQIISNCIQQSKKSFNLSTANSSNLNAINTCYMLAFMSILFLLEYRYLFQLFLSKTTTCYCRVGTVSEWLTDCEEFSLKYAPDHPILYYHLSLINALAKLPEKSQRNFQNYLSKYVNETNVQQLLSRDEILTSFVTIFALPIITIPFSVLLLTIPFNSKFPWSDIFLTYAVFLEMIKFSNFVNCQCQAH